MTSCHRKKSVCRSRSNTPGDAGETWNLQGSPNGSLPKLWSTIAKSQLCHWCSAYPYLAWGSPQKADQLQHQFSLILRQSQDLLSVLGCSLFTAIWSVSPTSACNKFICKLTRTAEQNKDDCCQLQSRRMAVSLSVGLTGEAPEYFTQIF